MKSCSGLISFGRNTEGLFGRGLFVILYAVEMDCTADKPAQHCFASSVAAAVRPRGTPAFNDDAMLVNRAASAAELDAIDDDGGDEDVEDTASSSATEK